MDAISVSAFAKVNLALEVLGRRPDGYHEIRTVLQTVSLRDELTFRVSSALSLRCNVPELETPSNLVLQAARLLRDESGVSEGVDVHLRKGIPVASGLGGGSSDAAATILALDRLWGLGMPQGRLLSMAAELGSDVPFFLMGGTAFAWGRGQDVMVLPDLPQHWLVLSCTDDTIEDKTGRLYGRLTEGDFSDGKRVDILVTGIEKGDLLADWMVNTFEAVALRVFPGLSERRNALMSAGAQRVSLSGAGPTLYALAADEESGKRLAERMQGQGLDARLAHTVSCP